jgi:hypothetical protein
VAAELRLTGWSRPRRGGVTPPEPLGLGRLPPPDLERCNLSARVGALVYHGWSRYVRLAHPKARREAIPRRPLRLAGLARLTRHAGPSRLLVTVSRAAGDHIKTRSAKVRKGLDHSRATAPQLPCLARWTALVRYSVAQILAPKLGSSPTPGLISPPLAIPAFVNLVVAFR